MSCLLSVVGRPEQPNHEKFHKLMTKYPTTVIRRQLELIRFIVLVMFSSDCCAVVVDIVFSSRLSASSIHLFLSSRRIVRNVNYLKFLKCGKFPAQRFALL